MAPIKSRFSIRSYAGKRQPKQSLIVMNLDDTFDRLLPSNLSKPKNLFESSSEHPNSSQSRDNSKQSPSISTPDVLKRKSYNSVIQTSSLKSCRIDKKAKTRGKKKLKVTKAMYLNIFKQMKEISSDESDDDVQFVSSTPNFKTLKKANESCSLSPSVSSKVSASDISELLNSSELDLKSSSLSQECINAQVFESACSIKETSRELLSLEPREGLSQHSSVDEEVSPHFNSLPEKTCLNENGFKKGSKISTSVKEGSIESDALLTQDDESILQRDKSEFYSAEEDSLRKSRSSDIEEALSRLSLAAPEGDVGSTSSPDYSSVTRRRRKNWGSSRFVDPSYSDHSMNSYLSQQQSLNCSDKGSDIDRRKIYQRLSRSLPASFKDRPPPFYSDRFSLPDIDLGRSRKTLFRLRDDSFSHPSLSCSTCSLPAVLEDQDQESSNDEELQASRPSFPFRKTSFDTNLGSSPLFLGFSNSEKSMARRTFVLKKMNSEEPCISPHTLPVLPENESDSSCEEDEYKRLESGSSSQVESPLMSPGVQGSPSRRGSTRISTSNSSETSLSSRSEGITSPLQDEMGNMLSPRTSSPDVAAGSSEEDSGSSPVRRDEQRRRRPSRLTKRTLGYIAEETESDSSEQTNLPNINRERLVLISGKKYRRSLAIINSLRGEENIMYEHKGRSYIQSLETVKMLQREDAFHGDSDDSSDMSPDSRRSFVNRNVPRNSCQPRHSRRFSTAMYCVNSTQVDVSVVCSNFPCHPSRTSSRVSHVPVLESSHQSTGPVEFTEEITEMQEKESTEAVILWISGQERCLNLRKLYDDNSLETWKKIGEGVYSEVFSLSRENQPSSVLKIIPVDGEIIVNGAVQKTLVDNLSEVLITHYLSDLRNNTAYYCDGFVQLLKVWYLEGAYPEELINLWNDFDINYGSDNDRPVVFPTDQCYLGLELVNSGRALESYTFSSARQSLAIFKQVVFSLATAEAAYEFEHRDLHWGNILIDKTKHKTLDYRIDGESYNVATNGVKATIIDYTWSSLTYTIQNTTTRIVNNMEQDPDLFAGSGDHQFEVYRLMREDVEQDWNRYQPRTNLRWLYYLADKLINRSKYLRPSANAHKNGIASLQKISDFIPNCDNSLQVALEILNYK